MFNVLSLIIFEIHIFSWIKYEVFFQICVAVELLTRPGTESEKMES